MVIMAYDRLKRLPPYDTDGAKPLAIEQLNWQGVNYVDEASALQQIQVPYAKNADFSNPIGAACKRGGKELLFTSLGSGGIKGTHTWKHSSGEVMLTAHDTSLYQCAGGSGGVPIPAASFSRASAKINDSGTVVASGTPYYKTGKFNNGIHLTESTSNLLSANQASVETDITGFTKINAGDIISRDTTQYWTGSASLKTVTPGSVNREGFFTNGISASANTAYTGSVYVKGSGNITVRLRDVTNSVLQDTNYTLTSTWTKVSATITTGTNPVTDLRLYVMTDDIQALTFYTDGLQIEQKAYDTPWYTGGGTRSADNLFYTLAASLPNDWFVTGFWIPDSDSTIDRTNNLKLATLFYDSNNRYEVSYYPSDDKLYFQKVYGGTSVYLPSVSLTFSAGDTIAFAAAHLTTAYSDLAAGMHLWYRINSGSVVHVSNTDTNLATAPVYTYAGCYSSAGFECNGIIDAVKLIDISKSDAMADVTVNNAWAEAHLTVTTATVADSATLLLANLDDTLNIRSTFTGTDTSYTLDLGNTPKTATISWTESLPGGSTLTVSVRSSTDGQNFGDWRTIATSGSGIPLARYIQVQVETTGTSPTISAISISYTTDYTSVTEIKTGLTGNRVRFADYRPKDYCIVCDGGRPLIVYKDGSGDVQVRNCGVDPPSSAPTLADGGAGSLTGTYLGKVTYVNDDGAESNPSSASGSLSITSKQISWTIPTGPTGTAKRRLYRTKAGGAAYYYVTEIADNTTTTYTDTTADSALGDASHPAMSDTNHVPPDSKIVFEFQNYIFYVPTADESQLWYSKVGEPEQVPNSSTSKNYKAMPGTINGGNSTYNALVIHGDDFVNPIIATSTGFIFDSSPTVDTTIVRHIDKAGALSHESMAMCVDPDLRQIMVFPTRTGVRFLLPGLQENSLESVPLSRNIQPYYDQAINRGNMAAVFFDNRYILSFCWQEPGAATATENNVIFAYDFRSKQWTGPWMIGASCFAIAGNELYCGDAAAGKIFKMFTGSSDAGGAIEMVLDLPVLAPAGIQGTCRFNRFLLEVTADSVTTSTQVKVKVDEREATVSLGTLTSTFSGDIRPGHNTMRSRKFAIPLPQGHTCSLRIVDNSTNPLCVTKAVVEYEVLPVQT